MADATEQALLDEYRTLYPGSIPDEERTDPSAMPQPYQMDPRLRARLQPEQPPMVNGVAGSRIPDDIQIGPQRVGPPAITSPYRFGPDAMAQSRGPMQPPPAGIDARVEQYLRGGGSRGAEQAPPAAPPATGERDLTPDELKEYNAPAHPPLLGAQDEAAVPVVGGQPEKFDPEKNTPEAEEKLRSERIRNLEKWKGVSEGLGKLGQGLAGLRGHLPPEAFAKPDTSAIDREIDRSEDLLSPEEEKMLTAAFGLNAGALKGMRRSTLARTLPSVSNYLEAKVRAGAAANKPPAKHLISAVGVTGLADYKALGKMVEQSQDLYEKAASKIGPIQSRTRSKWRQLAGSGDPDYTKFDQAVDQIATQYLFTKTGKQASDQERNMLKNQIMNKVMDGETFKASADLFLGNLTTQHNARLEGFGRAGYDVGELQPMEAKSTISVDLDGTPGEIPESAWPAFKAKHPTAKRK